MSLLERLRALLKVQLLPDPSVGVLELPRWLQAMGAAAIAFVIAAEFGADVTSNPLLKGIVTTLDVLLVAGFSVFVAVGAIRSRSTLVSWAIEERANLLLLTLSLLLLVVAPRAAATGVIIRLGLDVTQRVWDRLVGARARRLAELRPAQGLALSFVGIISVGTVLLALPASTADGLGASITDAAFTAASATSVTGLVVQDTGTYWSSFGIGVILLIIQVGAIGIMALASAFAVLVGGRLPGRSQDALNEGGFGDVMDVATVDGLKKLAVSIALLTIAIELAGALVLYVLWMVDVMPLREKYDSWDMAAWWCLFHSISAFCHAGFSLEPDSLVTWRDSYLINLIFIVLITLGAVGFPVLADLLPRSWRWEGVRTTWNRWHIQTKVVLITTLVLNGIGMVTYLFFEYDRSLEGLSVPSKVMAALFQSVSARSAGFNTVDIGAIGPPILIIFVVFFFIGSAPGSTGGGVRVTTAAVVAMAVRAMLRNRDDVELFGRTLPKTIVYRSISIVLIAGLFCAGFLVLVVATQDGPLDKLIFETFSAFGTVGLSMGSTTELDATGKWLLTGLMYVGRVGSLTLALAVGERVGTRAYRYPEGRMAVG